MELIKESDDDYILNGEGVWITVGTLSVRVGKTDEGVFVDIYRIDKEDEGSISGTYAFFDEAYDDDEEIPYVLTENGFKETDI